ncbi:MAG: hypothetical protein JWR88_834 [Pseudonocardia sp.]|nr:hypothetical protein [Pseudonocardia sp.]
MTIASPTQRIALPNEADDAARRIEGWLLESGIQIPDGPQQGGIAGWLDSQGMPEFVYLEIAGYYLMSMTWLASAAASSPDRAAAARVRARLTLRWITRTLCAPTVPTVPTASTASTAPTVPTAPPTRLHLRSGRVDWRNGGLFSFDLAMAARGVMASRVVAHSRDRRPTVARLWTLLDGISRDTAVMQSHQLVGGADVPLPDRWSTRPGPHHLKAAAGLLQVPHYAVGSTLRRVCQRTCEHWTAAMSDSWPCQELHTLFYGLEGMLIRAGTARGEPELASIAVLYARLMELQAPDGTLPETITGGAVRSDVLAQALRVGLMLRSRRHLQSDEWAERLSALAADLMGFVRPDGAVLFAQDQELTNAWCAMFAHQALRLFAHDGRGAPLTAAAFQLLV